MVVAVTWEVRIPCLDEDDDDGGGCVLHVVSI